jgi:hypothetical protein
MLRSIIDMYITKEKLHVCLLASNSIAWRTRLLSQNRSCLFHACIATSFRPHSAPILSSGPIFPALFIHSNFQNP